MWLFSWRHNFKHNLIEYKCLFCNKNYQQVWWKLKGVIFNTYNFSKHDKSKSILFVKKLLIFMNIWMGKLQWNFVTWKRRFLQSLKYGRYYWCRLHARKKSLQRFWKETFRRVSWCVCSKQYTVVNWCIWELQKFVSAPGLAWQATLKMAKVKLDLLTDIDMLLMVGKSIREGICHFD